MALQRYVVTVVVKAFIADILFVNPTKVLID